MANSLDDKHRMADTIVLSVRHRYGDRFSQEDIELLRERLTRASGILAALDRISLTNSDEPDFGFPVEPELPATGGNGQ